MNSIINFLVCYCYIFTFSEIEIKLKTKQLMYSIDFHNMNKNTMEVNRVPLKD